MEEKMKKSERIRSHREYVWIAWRFWKTNDACERKKIATI